MIRNIFLALLIDGGTLLITGCGELGSFSNDFDVVISDTSSVKAANEPITQNNILLGEIPPQTLESPLISLISTSEGL